MQATQLVVFCYGSSKKHIHATIEVSESQMQSLCQQILRLTAFGGHSGRGKTADQWFQRQEVGMEIDYKGMLRELLQDGETVLNLGCGRNYTM